MRRGAAPAQRGARRGGPPPLSRATTPARIGSRRRRRNPRTPVLEPAQVRAALSFLQPNERDHLLLSTLAETGARVGEVLNMRHVDWHTTGGGAPFLLIAPPGNAPPRRWAGRQP